MRLASLDIGGARWWLGDEVAERDVAPRLERALAAIDTGHARNVKSGRRKALYPLDLAGGGEADHLFKVNHYGGAHWWRPSKARRELERAEAVHARGLATPVPLAAGELRRGPRLVCCYLLVPRLRDVVDLRELAFGQRPAPRERRILTRGFGRFARQVLEAGIFQEDFAPNNFLVRRGEEPEFLIIDFERARLRPRLGESSWRFALNKLERELAETSQAERMRFLLAFSEGDRKAARRWWRAVSDAAPRLARRDLGRSLRNTTREGRRFRTLQLDSWRGFAHRDVSDVQLAPALVDLPEAKGRCIQAIGGEAGPSTGRAGPADLGTGVWRVVYDDLSDRERRRIWGTANLLHAHRHLAPRPLALLRRDRRTLLLLRRVPGEGRLQEHPQRESAEIALRLLVRRLLALGSLSEPPGPEAVALDAVRAQLLAPELLLLTGRATPDASRRARSLARTLAGDA